MKKHLLYFAILVAILAGTICCETEEDKDECEVENFGTVTVKNNTSTSIVVDVTEGSSEMNDERWISVGQSTTYKKIGEGSITIWASRSGDTNSWFEEHHDLSSCEEFTFTWQDAKKSAETTAMSIETSIHERVVEDPVIIQSTTIKE